jgi:hypothetical protein
MITKHINMSNKHLYYFLNNLVTNIREIATHPIIHKRAITATIIIKIFIFISYKITSKD